MFEMQEEQDGKNFPNEDQPNVMSTVKADGRDRKTKIKPHDLCKLYNDKEYTKFKHSTLNKTLEKS